MNKEQLKGVIDDLELQLSRTKKELNKSIAIENNAIELYTDGNTACLKIYLNELELSIVFKKRPIESQYGYYQFIPYESEVFDSNDETIKQFVNAIQIDNTNDLLSVLRTIGLYNPEGN